GAIVAEAARVLAPGGRLVLSVPYWNGARRLLAGQVVREGRRIQASGGAFYQFAFRRREVRVFLEAHGFRVLSFHPYDPARVWRGAFGRLAAALGGAAGRPGDRELPPRRDGREGEARTNRPAARRSQPVTGTRGFARTALRKVLYSDVALRLFGHMILAIAMKT